MTVPDRRPSRSDLGPVTRAYVKSMGWRSVNMHTHISLVNRYVYVEVPKAGCGTMKATLGGLEAARMNPGMVQRVQESPHNRLNATPFVKPFQLPPDLLEEVLTGRATGGSPSSATRPRACSPATSRRSARASSSRCPIVEAIRASTGRTVEPDQITLDQFLDVIGAQESRDQDPHWRRQADHLGLGIIDYDAIIHLEDLDASWDTIGALTSIATCRSSSSAATPPARAT